MTLQHESLGATDEALDQMMSRLRALLDGGALTEDAFVEICAIYNNVAYVFLYLESNEAHVDYERLLPWRGAFFDVPELDRRILELVRGLRCDDEEVEEARRAYVSQLEEKARRQDATDDAHAHLLDDAKAVLREIRGDQAQLLARLGIDGGAANPAATFYKLVSTTESSATRHKLSEAWYRTRDRRLDDMLDVVDRMVDQRRQRSREAGHESVLGQTLERCQVTEGTADAFLVRYVVQAVDAHERLAAEIRDATGAGSGDGDAMDHFGRWVRQLQGSQRVPLFDLDGCLDILFLIAREAFGLTVRRPARQGPNVLTVDVALGGRDAGQVNFDLWDRTSHPKSANTTTGIRNRADWAEIVQRPVAWVSCRFQHQPDGRNLITFQNVHSLFHEFGHAVNHLLIRRRIPNRSGLEYLPLERVEDLSMWFEKWVYHRDLSEQLELTPEDEAGLALCQQVKMLEYRRSHVDRAVTAALDFEVHRAPSGGVREAFSVIDDRFGVSRHCRLGDFPAYFTWPMFQAHPGANFAYLWGSAASAERFAPFACRSMSDMPPPDDVRASFSSCFDFDEPSVEPDSSAVFSFYESGLQR